MNSPLQYAELPDALMGEKIRKVARIAGVSFAVAAAVFSANGGNVAKAINVAKEVR